MNKAYVTVTTTEGGCDYDTSFLPEDVPFSVNRWYNADGGTAILEELGNSEIGDMITLDGCSTCFVVKGDQVEG